VTANVGIGPRDNGEGLALHVELLIDLPDVGRDIAQDLVRRAHVICPYSEATQNNFDVRLRMA
jgi:organic hydroperoxide reductase OsmC/OhrA